MLGELKADHYLNGISFLCNDEDGDKFERQDVDIASPPSPPRRSRARPTQLQETQRYCVVAKDISQLLAFLKNKRGIDDVNIDIKIGLDGSQGFLKVTTTSIIEEAKRCC